MDIVLIPGMWLDGSSWDEIVPALEEAGHRTHALTLPGMESKDTDRSEITLRDHVDALVGAIDAIDPANGKVVLVGHSAGGPLAHAAVDARPDRVARVIYVASEPRGNGPGGGGYPIENGEVPLPDWSFFDDEMVADLDDELRTVLRERAIPTPAHVTTDPQELADDRRYGIPITLVACEYSSAMLQEWTGKGSPGTEELSKMRDVEYVDLPSGHWPQFTRPKELSQVILTSIRDLRGPHR